MQISDERRIAASREAVWAALNDPDVLRRCIPGCQRLEQAGENSFAATVEVKIGPIGARFDATVNLTDLDPPASYTIVGEGKGGMAGNAKGSAFVKLAAEGPATTLLSYSVDAEVGGRLAQLGGPVIEATARQLAQKFFAEFERAVTGQAAIAVGASATTAATSATGMATSSGNPMAWIMALAVAVLAGFIVGRGGDDIWQPLAVAGALILAGLAGYASGKRKP